MAEIKKSGCCQGFDHCDKAEGERCSQVLKCDRCVDLVNAEVDVLQKDKNSNVIQKEESYRDNFTANKNTKNFKCRYTCNLCGENFQYTKQVSSHLKAHEIGYKCDSCPKVFLKKQSIAAHVLTHVKKLKFCCYCGKYFEYEELLIHLPSHFDFGFFQCDKCQSVFSDESSLNSHMITHADTSTVEKDGSVQMEDGSMQVEDGSVQMEDGNVQIENGSVQKFFPEVNNMNNNIKDRHYCCYCIKSYRNFKDLKQHLNKSHGKTSFIDDSKFSYKCETCFKKFCYSLQLEIHQSFHFNQLNC